MATPESRSERSFHTGEVALQREVGVAERMARLGPQVIRDHLPEQHRAFFRLLPFIIVGSLDERGLPSASLLTGPPGFAWSPSPASLRVTALPIPGDPLEQRLNPGAPLGLLGIQPHTRRRNRLNGRVLERHADGFSVSVDQSFGNCPKYIHPRELEFIGPRPSLATREATRLDDETRALVSSADTFFLASAHPEATTRPTAAHGVDVSHRGGPAGFLHFVGADRFIMPDFPGNNFYNTLGNLRLAPEAGLLFLDPVRGHLLQLSATAEALHGAHPLVGTAGTGRIVRFDVHGVRLFPEASPLRLVQDGVAPVPW